MSTTEAPAFSPEEQTASSALKSPEQNVGQTPKVNFRTVFDSLFTPVFATNADGNICFKNAMASSLKFIKLGKSALRLLSTEDKERFLPFSERPEHIFIFKLRVRTDIAYMRALLFSPQGDSSKTIYWILMTPIQEQVLIGNESYDIDRIEIIKNTLDELILSDKKRNTHKTRRSPEEINRFRTHIWNSFSALISRRFGDGCFIDFKNAADILSGCRISGSRLKIKSTVEKDIESAVTFGTISCFDRISALYALIITYVYIMSEGAHVNIEFSASQSSLRVYIGFSGAHKKIIKELQSLTEAFTDIKEHFSLHCQAEKTPTGNWNIELNLDINAYSYIECPLGTKNRNSLFSDSDMAFALSVAGELFCGEIYQSIL